MNIFMEFVVDDIELTQGYIQEGGATSHTSHSHHTLMTFITSFLKTKLFQRTTHLGYQGTMPVAT